MALNIEQSALWVDIKKIFDLPTPVTDVGYHVMLHTEDEDLPLLKMKSLDISRDYVKHLGDQTILKCVMPLGDYVNRVYRHRRNMEISLKRSLPNFDPKRQSEVLIRRYKAVLPPKLNPQVSGTDLSHADHESMNYKSFVDVTFELLEMSLEPMLLKTTSGIYRQVTPKQLITSVMATESAKVLVYGKPAITSIDIVPPDATALIAQASIPSGHQLLSLPRFVQDKFNGLYSGGVGTYLQSYKGVMSLFIYPILSSKRFDQPVDKLVIYVLPERRFPTLDKTYRVDGHVLSILTTSDKKYSDSGDLDYMNHGVGFRMADAKAMMKKPIKMTPEGPQGDRTSLNYEVAIEQKADGLNYAPVTEARISANPYVEQAKVLFRSMARVTLSWHHSDPELLYPGMPVKYTFLQGDEIVSLVGTLVYVSNSTLNQGTVISDSMYKTLTSMVIMVERHLPTSKPPLIKTVGKF